MATEKVSLKDFAPLTAALSIAVEPFSNAAEEAATFSTGVTT